MSDPGNPTDPEGDAGSEPDPNQPGWASPTPPPPAEPPSPAETQIPPAAVPPPPTPAQQPPVWGTTPAAAVPPPPVVPGAPVAGGPSDPNAWTQVGAAPAPRKRRLTWLWILIPVLLVFTVATVVAITFGVKILVGPVDATNDYYADVRDQNYSAAYDRLCRPLQVKYSESRYENIERGLDRTSGGVTSYNFDNSELRNSRAYVTGTVRRSSAGNRRFRITLVKEDGDWKVCDIRQRS